jgi:hypothetical protein
VLPRRKSGGNHGTACNDQGVQGSPGGGAVGGPARSTSERDVSGNAFPGGSGCGEQLMASALGARPSGRRGGDAETPRGDALAHVRALWRRRPGLKFKVPTFGCLNLINFKINSETY